MHLLIRIYSSINRSYKKKIQMFFSLLLTPTSHQIFFIGKDLLSMETIQWIADMEGMGWVSRNKANVTIMELTITYFWIIYNFGNLN